jgi:hypothetical protein
MDITLSTSISCINCKVSTVILASARVSAAGDHEHAIWKLNNSEPHVTPYNIHTQAGRINPFNKHQKRAPNTFQCGSHNPLPPSFFPTNTAQKDSHSHKKDSSVSYTTDLPIQKLRFIRLGKHASVLLLSLLLLLLLLLPLLLLPLLPLPLLSLLLCPPLPPCAVVD